MINIINETNVGTSSINLLTNGKTCKLVSNINLKIEDNFELNNYFNNIAVTNLKEINKMEVQYKKDLNKAIEDFNKKIEMIISNIKIDIMTLK